MIRIDKGERVAANFAIYNLKLSELRKVRVHVAKYSIYRKVRSLAYVLYAVYYSK